MENKKIINATIVVYNNIKFRSKSELACYKRLEESGLNFSYETEKIVLWEGFKPSSVLIYYPNKIKAGSYNRELILQEGKIRNITYTPDFIVTKGNYKIYIEYKGNPNDSYPRVRKMFLKYLESKKDGINYIFIEPHNIRQVKQAIDIINNLK